MKLSIKKPISIIKVHTTGLDVRTDRMVGITITKFEPSGKRISGTRLINPEREIPQEAIAIHGITNEVADKEKTFDQVGKNLYDFINDSDIVGFNVRFDLEMLMAEFDRLGLSFTVHNREVIDLYDLYVKLNPRTFKAAVAQYVDSAVAVVDPISTERYVDMLEPMMDNMLKPLESEGEDLVAIAKKCGTVKTLDVRGWFALDENNKAVFNIGKHKGKPVADTLINHSDYYDWMRTPKAEVPKDALNIAERILKKAKNSIIEGA